jgi:hypothetical protein
VLDSHENGTPANAAPDCSFARDARAARRDDRMGRSLERRRP